MDVESWELDLKGFGKVLRQCWYGPDNGAVEQ